MTTQESQTSRQKVDQVRAMMQPEFDWGTYYDNENGYEDLDDLFRQCILVDDFESEADARRYIAAGSAKIEDTPASLYRVLYLLKPEKISFSDMYKISLLSFFSADKRFFVDVGFYKYELDLRFYALRELVDTSEATGVYCGVPGLDNGYHMKDEDGTAFFEMVKEAINSYKWPVYPGNNFEV